jgi:N-formylglutamate amidohydrolase
MVLSSYFLCSHPILPPPRGETERYLPHRLIGVFALLSLLVHPARANESAAADLVLVQQGRLPIILTAPHGGREAIPGIAPRRSYDKDKIEASRKWGGLDTGGDADTDILVQGIATEIERIIGKKPYLVMAKFARKYVDANRPAELALDNSKAIPYYEYYHNTIRGFIDEARGKYPAVLLIDVHGQKKDPEVLMRGTINGRSVARLLNRAGVPAVTGPNGIFGQLEAHGFKVFPGNDVPPSGTAENAGYNGGYTVLMSSNAADGVDAVQFEFGTRYRRKAMLNKSAEDAGKAIAAFYEIYLKNATPK